MNKSIDALTARTQFGGIMEKANKDQTRFVVNKRGKPSVVILSVEDYLRNVVKRPSIVVELQQEAAKSGLSKMTDAEIQKEIKAARRAIKTK